MLIVKIVREVPSNLTAVEVELWRLLVSGESQHGIGEALRLGESDTLAVQESLMGKLGIDRKIDLVREGIYAGL